MIKPGDKCFAVMGVDSGDGGEWLINAYAHRSAAESAVESFRALRPARMTETTTSYRIEELVLL